MIRKLISILFIFIEICSLPFLFLFAIIFRFKKNKQFDVGLGPEPILSNYYTKLALEKYGYTAETFVFNVYVIFDKFDFRADLFYKSKISKLFIPYFLYFRILKKYKSIYIFFNGGALAFTFFLWKFEPFLYKIANVKTVVLPYGSDVQEMSRSKNLIFKNAVSNDYPLFKKRRKKIEKKIDLWTSNSSHVVGGCEWVDYMHHWDTLTITHWPIDTESWAPKIKENENDIFYVMHAPNHKKIKGSSHIVKAINELKKEGYKIELVFKEKINNEELKDFLKNVDLVIDQLIIGWYGFFAVEAMSLGKPVMCFLREDLIALYEENGLIEENEIPIINVNFRNIKEEILNIYNNKVRLTDIGLKSRVYVQKHHSLEYIGGVFNKINQSIGI